MIRREFLQTGVGLLGLAGARNLWAGDDRGEVVTVGGSIPPEKLGVTLSHEHVLVDFIGAAKISRDRYDAEEVFRVALPHLKRVRELGCRTLVECTPAYLGRDPALLQRLAKASGLQVLTNTGYYGARKGKFLPAHARTESPDQLARRWLGEWKEGIEGTGIRPGFLKVGVDAGPLAKVNRKLIRAAARTHRDSGLTIAAHTGDGTAALEELKVLREEGVEGSAFIWVHAQNEKDPGLHARAAEQGAWVEFDGIKLATVRRHVDLVRGMKGNGHLGRVLLSHDAGWYHVGQPGGGTFRGYDTLFSDLLPALKAAGFTAAEVRRLTVDNPHEAFTVRVRTREGGG
jgi:phosphotriesterase-related protein